MTEKQPGRQDPAREAQGSDSPFLALLKFLLSAAAVIVVGVFVLGGLVLATCFLGS